MKLLKTLKVNTPSGVQDLEISLVNENLICIKDLPDYFWEELIDLVGVVIDCGTHFYLPQELYIEHEVEDFLVS